VHQLDRVMEGDIEELLDAVAASVEGDGPRAGEAA
jgi:hypothetical protein